MQYRFYLDGNLIEEQPIGWDAITVDAVRDNDLKGVFVKASGELTFTNDGYTYIKSLFDIPGYCQEISVSIHRSVDEGQNFIERYRCLTFISDAEFDDFNCSVKVKLTDDSFYGRIDNRRSTPAYLTGTKTINGENDNLTPATIFAMQLFDPATGVALPTLQTHGIYRVYDALSYLVSYMSDNEVEFDSPIFGTGGDFANLGLTFGYPIWSAGNGVDRSLAEFTANMPSITFETLFKELDHRLNLGMFIDTTGAKPKIIIDYWRELFISNDLTTFPDLPNLKTSIAKDLIYSSIKFGGTKSFDSVANSFPARIRFVGWWPEVYAILGKCNVDNTLDLSYDFLSDNNSIEQISVLSGVDQSFNSDWFLIDSDRSATTLVARQSNWLTAGAPFYYNERLTNFEVSKRYLGFVPDAIAAYLGNADNSIFAHNVAAQILTGAFQGIAFSSDSPLPYHDVNALWDTALNRYAVPLTGIYSVGINLIYLTHYPIELRIVAERRDAGDVTVLSETVLYQNIFVPADQPLTIDVSTLVSANATDFIHIKAYQGGNPNFTQSSVFHDAELIIDNVADGGGIYQTYDPANYPIILNEFTTEIKTSQVDAIIADPLSKLRFYIEPSVQKSAWIDDVSINEFEGTITAKLLSSRTEEPKLPPLELRQVQFSGSLPDTPFDISLTDFYGNPLTGDNITNRVLFYEVGKALNVSIGAAHMGCAAGNASGFTIYITKTTDLGVVTVQSVSVPALSISFIVESGTDYLVQLGYDLGGVGNTFPVVAPVISAPTTVGTNGSATIFVIAPSVLGDYTFLWNGPGGITGTTNVIIGPAGDYTCLVTYTPGTFDNNMILFNVQIPISETGA